MYTLTLTSTGKTTITDTVSLTIGETHAVSYEFHDDIRIEPSDLVISGSDAVGSAIVASALRQDTGFDYMLIGVDGSGTVYAEKSAS